MTPPPRALLGGDAGNVFKTGAEQENTEFPCSSAFPINHLSPAPWFSHQYTLGQEESPWQSSSQIFAMGHWPLFPSPRKRTHFILSLGKFLPMSGPAGPKIFMQSLQRAGHTPTLTPHTPHLLGLHSQAEVRGIEKLPGLSRPQCLPSWTSKLTSSSLSLALQYRNKVAPNPLRVGQGSKKLGEEPQVPRSTSNLGVQNFRECCKLCLRSCRGKKWYGV